MNIAPFDEDFLKKLEYLNIVSRRLISGHLRAERRSRRKGAGIEFSDHRLYAPGDDFRYLDWQAYLRLNKLLLRLFEEEEDLPIYLFIDSSRSMSFGRPSKFNYALKLAAALAYIGLANLDQVSLFSFAENINDRFPPLRGKNQILRIFQFLSGIRSGGPTSTVKSFKTWFNQDRRKGLVVLLSDLQDPDGFRPGLDLLRTVRQDALVIHLMSRDDFRPELEGDFLLEDSESGETVELAVTPESLRAYQEKFEQFCADVQSYCWKYQLSYVRAPTSVTFEDLVLKVFRQGRFLK